MKYRILYLPVDKPLEDGDIVVDQNGSVFTFIENTHNHLKNVIKPAKRFIVKVEYNEMTVVGPISPFNSWANNNYEFPSIDAVWSRDKDLSYSYLRIKCPVCGVLH